MSLATPLSPHVATTLVTVEGPRLRPLDRHVFANGTIIWAKISVMDHIN